MKWLVFALIFVFGVGLGESFGKKKRIDRGIVKHTFVPKGQWFFGGTCSYAEMAQENFKFLVLKNWKGAEELERRRLSISHQAFFWLYGEG